MTCRTAVAALVGAAALAGCTASDVPAGGAAAGSGSAPLEVAVGFYPYEFVVERVGGPDVAVTNLTPPGGEPHDVELSPRQVADVAGAGLVVYSKGFQPAVDEAVAQQAADRALDVLGVVELSNSEGGSDPHVWLDPVRLAAVVEAVADRLSELAPQVAPQLRGRGDQLRFELAELDREMRTGLASCSRRQIVTSHDAFGYLARAYGLEQVPIAGLSPEEEASPGRLAEIAVQARAGGVTTIFFEELVSPKVAQSLAREIGASAAVLNPVEGPPDSGDYLDAMRENLGALRSALGCT